MKTAKTHPKKTPVKIGRPKLVNEKQLTMLSSFGCSYQEIATFFGVTPHHLQVRFAPVYAKGRDKLKLRLRRAQIKLALSGNATMQIWLGKQYLDQKESQEESIDVNTLREVADIFKQAMVRDSESGKATSGDSGVSDTSKAVQDNTRGQAEL